MFTAGAGQAQLLNKCLDQVDGHAIKLFSTYAKALKKCKVAIQKQVDDEEPDWEKAADACEKSLGSLWDINGIRGKSALTKFYAKFNDKFFADEGKCDSNGETAGVGTAYISAMGHLISPVQAPGPALGPAHDWMMRWMALMKFKLALLEENFVFATTMNLLNDVIDNSGTDCDLPTNCDPESTANCRPNLCSTMINCRSHACQLDASSATGTSVGGGALVVSVPLTGRAVFEVCKLNPVTFGIAGAPNVFAIIGDSSRTVDPVILLGNTICVDIIRAQGFCDCMGLGIPKNTAFCQDHNVNVGASCIGAPTGVNTVEGPCLCADGSGNPVGPECGTADDPVCSNDPNNPLLCGVTETGGFCHAGTTNSPVFVLPSGGTANGDCLVLNTIQFKTLPPLPGIEGPDGVPCTMDDVRPPAGAASVPFTTGTASAAVLDAVDTPGGCTNAPNHLCIEDVNCNTNDPNTPTGTCVGAIINPNQTVPALTGGGLADCADLEASQLGGVSFVGAFPALDGAGLGDVVSTFNFDCQ
jgi:hypothetical protein